MSTNSKTAVVLVDDNPDDLFINQLVVKKSILGVDASEFSNPISALSYLANNQAEDRRIILLDINMPYIDGFGFLDKYKETCTESIGKDIIIILTTSMHSLDKKKAEASPLVRCYLRKPLTVKGFNELVESLEIHE